MRRYIFLFIIFLVFLGSFIFFPYLQKNTYEGFQNNQEQMSIANQSVPYQSDVLQGAVDQKSDETIISAWIEVGVQDVFLMNGDGTEQLTNLKTGDDILSGSRIMSNQNGQATIHFPDGSVARLGNNSEIVVENSSYNPASEKLSVKIRLYAGNVWSKVLELATPDSSWEVVTTNTVATVRGTAFGAEIVDEKSYWLGSEHEVDIYVVDPETRENLHDVAIKLIPDTFMEVSPEIVTRIKTNNYILPSKLLKIPEKMKSAKWFKNAVLSDQNFNKEVQKMLDNGMTKAEIREEFRLKVKKDLEQRLDERTLPRASEDLKKQEVRELVPIDKRLPLKGAVQLNKNAEKKSEESNLREEQKLEEELKLRKKLELQEKIKQQEQLKIQQEQKEQELLRLKREQNGPEGLILKEPIVFEDEDNDMIR